MEDEQLTSILRDAVEMGASDIHLKVGVTPYVRVHGSLKTYGSNTLSKEDLERMVLSLMDGDAERMKSRGEQDIAHTVPGVARFRCNVFRQRGSLEIVMRVVPYTIPDLDDLGLPQVLKHIALESRGMVLVTGITGSGKSTTIASMIQHVNKSLPVHIVTLEDPIEFVYRDEMASISQREVGIDTDDFHSALKYVLRQDPDVIVLGEMRDPITAATALTAAETGHLVFSTLHTADTLQTVDRVIDMFPPTQHNQVRHQLSVNLKAVVSMRLIKRADGKGVAPAIEILINTPAIRALIEEGKFGEIRGLIQEGASQYGMQTFDQSILALYKSKVITKENAMEEASSPAELELAMRGITKGTFNTSSFLQGKDNQFYKKKAAETFQRARRMFDQDLNEDSLREVRKVLVDDPEHQEAQELLAKLEERLKKADSAVQVEPFIRQGLDLVSKDRFDEAIAVFNQGLAKDPNNHRLLTMKQAAEEKKHRQTGIKPLMDSAQEHLQAGRFAEAKQSLQEVLKKDPGNSGALDLFSDLLKAQSEKADQAEIDTLAAKAEDQFAKKMHFDAISTWNLVRKIQADHQRAVNQITEAAAELKKVGVPGLASAGQVPWAATISQAFERGLTQFVNGQSGACMNEWRQAVNKTPQAVELLSAYTRKVEEMHAAHVNYHVERAKKLASQNELGKAIGQVRWALHMDPNSAAARSQFDAIRPSAEQTLQRYLSDADQWEKTDRLRAALFCLERAYEINAQHPGLKQKLDEMRSRIAKNRDLLAAMDRKST